MQIDQNFPVTFTMPLRVVDVLMDALGRQPYANVAGAISSIQTQVNQQVKAAQQNETTDEVAAPVAAPKLVPKARK